ncbi:hypothetical protein [Terriglobus saanensis]|uniref:Uncharacterized protein n=1 Tax=Terriglobus saanensis (strain ATCC BAA-1853 / DSM 23119 / SP1PR4) TaxID=401053 RepID=E8V6P5_TERSS|nr:hypothetical protein [Terriglobus saanensis]ADV83847.1 hypothetical protein AciPR4_3088 [Terriglobus saanensis SP1PR4]
MVARHVHSQDPSKNKHRGRAASNAAFLAAKQQTEAVREQILAELRRKPFGLTCKELAERVGRPMHSISGRIAELKLADRVQATDERRDGGTVIVALNPQRGLLSGMEAQQ